MGRRTGSRIILIVFSTTGKSEVGRQVADYLGWELIDTDEDIVRLTGKSIDEIFAQDGEEHFRQIERQVLSGACARERAVISAGGGAILDPRNRELMNDSGVVICLEASAETIYERLLRDEDTAPVRPLLEVPDPLRRIRELKSSRQSYYSAADWTVHTDHLSLEQVCREVVRGWYYWNHVHRQEDLACEVVTAIDRYPVFVRSDLLERLGQVIRQAGLSGTAYVISDETVYSLHGGRVVESLRKAGLTVESLCVPPGEATKSIGTATKIYDWLIEHRAERSDTVVALGGGMVGDLGGFVAATFLRGLPVVQVPTSLVAMVDASLGGKTAVNHPLGKNLIGVFYQPRLVVADVDTLNTLSHRELVCGWAEVIKHGLVLDADLLAFLEDNADRLSRLGPETTVEAIGRSAAIKAMIVSEDEREKGRRTLLNYGHTIAHGLEAVTGYQRFLHGEAVAIGMMGAAMLAYKLGLLSSEVVDRQRMLLERFGLPTACSGVDITGVLNAMELDKKVENKAIRWVMLTDVGQSSIQDDVAIDLVANTLEDLLRSSERGNQAVH